MQTMEVFPLAGISSLWVDSDEAEVMNCPLLGRKCDPERCVWWVQRGEAEGQCAVVLMATRP
jgi:hypothetical protein